MLKNISAHLVLILALGCAGPVFAQTADPTLQQIYDAAKGGHLDQAQQMMNQVLRDHPKSGKAHYIAAELYVREGNNPAARQELSTAEALEPGLPFLTNRDGLQKLQRELAEGQGLRPAPRYAPGPANSQVHSAIPWGLVLIVVGAIAVLWAVMRRRTATAVYQQGGVGPMGGPGGPGYGPGPGYGGGGIGSGIAGGLASGLAVGAGVVAGEELAHHFLDGNREGNVVPGNPQNPNGDMGGNDFGVSNDGGWDDGGSVGGDVGGGGDGGGGDWT